jgi:hypothetical protein
LSTDNKDSAQKLSIIIIKTAWYRNKIPLLIKSLYTTTMGKEKAGI